MQVLKSYIQGKKVSDMNMNTLCKFGINLK